MLGAEASETPLSRTAPSALVPLQKGASPHPTEPGAQFVPAVPLVVLVSPPSSAKTTIQDRSPASRHTHEHPQKTRLHQGDLETHQRQPGLWRCSTATATSPDTANRLKWTRPGRVPRMSPSSTHSARLHGNHHPARLRPPAATSDITSSRPVSADGADRLEPTTSSSSSVSTIETVKTNFGSGNHTRRRKRETPSRDPTSTTAHEDIQNIDQWCVVFCESAQASCIESCRLSHPRDFRRQTKTDH